MDTIDIVVVLVSEFFDKNRENNIEHLLAEGFVEGEKGVLKRVNINRPLEMCLHFPGIERAPYRFEVDQPQLDSVGFVIDHFKEIGVRSPANGKVKISKMQKGDENESLWILNVYEENQEIEAEVVHDLKQSSSPEIPPGEQSPSPDVSPVVVKRTTKLTQEEIVQMSRELGVDWDNLAALMNIPYYEREEIRFNFVKYQSYSSKAEQIFELFNNSECFDRNTLVMYLKELKRHDVKKKMLPLDEENESEEVGIGATAMSQPKMQLENDTPLSSREMYRLSRHLVVNWDRLAALLGISAADRDEVRYNNIYYTSHSRGEKMLAIFNNMEDFSRQKLAECLKEMGLLELKDPVIKGEWRKLIMKTVA